MHTFHEAQLAVPFEIQTGWNHLTLNESRWIDLGCPVRKRMAAGKKIMFMMCETEWRIASDSAPEVKAPLFVKAWLWSQFKPV